MTENYLNQEAVKSRMEEYFQAVYNADVEKLKTIFHKKAIMSGFLGDVLLCGDPSPFYEDLSSKPSMKETSIDCRFIIKSLQVCQNIASVTLLVDGFYGTATLEDHFHLIKENEIWYITSKTFTTI